MPRTKGEQNPRKCHPREETQKGGEESGEERRSERTQKCRNINRPRQFKTQRCNAMKKKSDGGRKIIPLSVEVGKEWKREGESRDCRERARRR